MTIHYRAVESMDDLEKVVDLEMLVWGLPARDAVPSNLLHAMVNSGSLVVGAYDDNRLIGMALMFPTSHRSRKRLWSHMAAVHPEYQGQGIGFELKQFQRRWALDQDYTEICWTFDPIQRGNANFNLHILGGVTDTYHVNFYGEMTDGINGGLPSDRVEVIWKLKNQRVKQLAEQKSPSPLFVPNADTDSSYLLHSVDNQPILNSLHTAQQIYLVEIPSNINTLKQTSGELALAWRIALRNAFQVAFQAGYSAQDFITINGRFCYVLVSQQTWYMYVVQCNDQTLYTGVTPDLAQRVQKHNAGRGAAYTRARRPVELIAAWRFADQQKAMKAEFAFKRLPRHAKLDHIASRHEFANGTFVDHDA